MNHQTASSVKSSWQDDNAEIQAWTSALRQVMNSEAALVQLGRFDFLLGIARHSQYDDGYLFMVTYHQLQSYCSILQFLNG